ncbi:sigma D regulator [Pseudomonas sp. gcc21]|uniref:sigma D regulator n=1 Tax=Pseudomonas sp. gcc21 TaxID=2726989 RepID=UPI00145264C5|nr:sigma D regulator [Pseudomonas sp. gcc21]QJD59529.1 sigma D regulator [Pseudomonas sp. gcc21]
MLDSCTTAQERWGGVNEMVDRWLAERKQVVLEFSALRDRAPSAANSEQALGSFCTILIDYVCAGHFEIYEQLTREAEELQDVRSLDLAGQVYPRIQTITQAALTFNDRYGDTTDFDEETMQKDLKVLGGLLHERFELEDCLIEVLHNCHQDMLSAPEKLE